MFSAAGQRSVPQSSVSKERTASCAKTTEVQLMERVQQGGLEQMLSALACLGVRCACKPRILHDIN